MRGPSLDTAPVRSGVERVRKLNERERDVKKYGEAGAGTSGMSRSGVKEKVKEAGFV